MRPDLKISEVDTARRERGTFEIVGPEKEKECLPKFSCLMRGTGGQTQANLKSTVSNNLY